MQVVGVKVRSLPHANPFQCCRDMQDWKYQPGLSQCLANDYAQRSEVDEIWRRSELNPALSLSSALF